MRDTTGLWTCGLWESLFMSGGQLLLTVTILWWVLWGNSLYPHDVILMQQ